MIRSLFTHPFIQSVANRSILADASGGDRSGAAGATGSTAVTVLSLPGRAEYDTEQARAYRTEIESMARFGFKVELQSLFAYGFDFLAHSYLPRKLLRRLTL